MKAQVASGRAVGADSRIAIRRRAFFGLKLVVSIGLLSLIVYSADLREVAQTLAMTDLRLIAFAPLLNLVGVMLISMRWQGLLASQGHRISLIELMQSCLVAGFFRQFLPSTLGGDVIRAYDAWRWGSPKTQAVSTLAVDRIFGLLVLTIIASIALAFFPALLPGFPALLFWLLGGFMLLSGLLVVLFVPTPRISEYSWRAIENLPRPLMSIAETFLTAVGTFQGKHDVIVRSLLLSLALQVNVVLFYILIGESLGFEIPLTAYFVIVPIAVFVMLMPVSINAIGVREGVFVLLLGLFGTETAQALAFAWLEYALFLFFGLIGGVVFALRRIV